MRQNRLKISAGAVLLAAVLYYIGDGKTIAAALVPVAVHELGHLLCLKMLGMRVEGFRAELKGFCIDYKGNTGALGHALAAAMGPAAGLLYAWAASWAGNRYASDWLCLSAGVSLLLSLFNLLPALPLDGGRILANLSWAFLGERRSNMLVEITSLVIGVSLLALGLWLAVKGRGIALAVAAIWLLLYQDGSGGIVKSHEIL